MIDYTSIILAIISLIGAVITGFLIPVLREKYGQEKLDTMNAWMRVFCAAAETAFKSGEGPLKKEWVLERMNEMGITMSAEQMDACLEAIVRELRAAGVLNKGKVK